MKKRVIRVGIVVFLLLVMLAYANKLKNRNDIKKMTDAELTVLTKSDDFAVVSTKVEMLNNPMGLDISKPSFSWQIQSEHPDKAQVAYRIEVMKLTNDNEQMVWDSGFIKSEQTLYIPYGGEPLASHGNYSYTITCVNASMQAAVSEKGYFQTAYVEEQPFRDAKMICMQGEENVYDEGQAIFIKEFVLSDKPLKKATIYATALGIYDAYMNGKRVGNDELKPGWSDYQKSLYYNTYDITDLICSDNGNGSLESESKVKSNKIAVMLGTGWWCGRVGFGTYDYHKPAFICTIRLEYADGEIEEIHTDETWKYYKDTAVVSADIFNGEVYDANRLTTREASFPEEILLEQERDVEKANMPEVKDVVISTDFTGTYRSFYGSQVQNVKEFDRKPEHVVIYDSVSKNGTKYGEIIVKKESSFIDENEQSVIPLKKGETAIIDMGQNMTGVPFISFTAPKGSEIKVDFAEMLNDSGSKKRGNDGPKGSLYTANYRSALSDLTIISNGEEKQEYQPVFTYYGFRYLSVTATEDIVLHEIKGKFIGNSALDTGEIATDNEMLNRLYENVRWTQRNNFLHVATDCPQRDERLGWMGDLQVFAKTSLYNQDLFSFYKKWCQDAKDSQTKEGAYTDTVPTTITTGSGNAGWADAGISVPYNLYCMYGDKRFLEDSYESMQRYMDYLEGISNFSIEDGRVGALTTYGDWLGVEDSDKELISTLCYAKAAMQMEEIAKILDDSKAARKYKKLHEEIKAYFRKKYMTDGHISEAYRTQSALALALMYDVLNEEQTETAVTDLKDKIVQADMTITTGFLGTPVILKALSQNGELALAYELLLQEKNPSWIYSIKQGATTIWERYDSYTIENGFADVAMNSFNHFNNGSVVQWMYEDMLGISVSHMTDRKDIQNVVEMAERTNGKQNEDEKNGMEQNRDGVPVISLKPGILLDLQKMPIHEVSGSYQSVYGKIEAAFTMNEERIIYQVTLPISCEAILTLPIYDEKGKQDEKTQILSGGSHQFIYDRTQNMWEVSKM